ncbi:MAG TPA: hypothetical protein VMA95_09200 [Streptosporangiaceae bacterium]|nr:hypothetical protein [Streptosporangiaceae bacterium]
MTTVTTPAATGYSRSPRNLSLAWNTWRRHRLAALLIAAAMVLGTGAVLLSGRQYDRM